MDDPAMAPSFFTVVTDDWVLNASSVTERGDDDVVRGTGESNTFSWEANDPRITGTATMIVNETDYRESAILAPTGDRGSVRTGLLRIVNDGGSWEGPITHVVLTNQGAERNSIAGWLTGTDSYEGLRAYVVSEFEDGTFWGHITAESPPPPPEGPSE
jgi:hypothetical protein